MSKIDKRNDKVIYIISFSFLSFLELEYKAFKMADYEGTIKAKITVACPIMLSMFLISRDLNLDFVQ